MADVYGKAGHGAMVQAVESAANRLSFQNPNTNSPDSQSGSKSIGTLRKILLGIFGFFGFIGITSSAWVFMGFNLFIVFLIWATAPVDNKNTPSVQGNMVNDEIRADMFKAYQTLRDGGEVKDSPFQGDEISWALGGLAEERTSKRLQEGLNDSYDIIDDIAILNNRGQVNANIDHLVLSNNGAIMLDTKVWKTPLVFSGNNGQRWLDKERNPKTWSAVSTCLYEASQLPVPPRAIVFVVAGKAGRELEKYATPVQVTKYFERYEDSGLKECVAVPVFFTSQFKVVESVRWVEKSVEPAWSVLGVDGYKKTGNLRF